jgi:hypothetical protein
MHRLICIVVCIESLLMVAPMAHGNDLQVAPSYAAGAWLDMRQPFELSFSRPISAADGRVVIFVGPTDVTDLFQGDAQKHVYTGDNLPLPSGQHELVVSLVSPAGVWIEVGRLSIKVRTKHGLDKSTTTPTLDLANKGQVGEGHRPGSNQPDRSTYQDATIQAAINSEHGRGGFSLRTQGRVVGASYVNEAIRFGQKGVNAPRIDLSDYRIDVQRGKTTLSIGNVAYGSLRHLVHAFASRGAMLTWKLGRAADFEIAALNGTSIVGWDNFLGLSNRDHQILGATLGLELVPSRAGALRLESTIFRGSAEPLTNYTQGAIRSAEKSDGLGARIVVSSPQQRFVADAGYASSEFRDRADPQLEGGLTVTAIPNRRRNAFYADASFALLKERTIFGGPKANVVLGYHVEKVDPLYRSLGASLQPDLLRHAADVTMNVGAFTTRISRSESEDNLEAIRSILKTKTRRTEWNAGVPLAALTGARGVVAGLLPTLAMTVDRTHQFGDAIPTDSDFSASHVPDQLSTAAMLSAGWQMGQYVNTTYRFTRADQDNRQPGRERADLSTRGHGLSVSVAVTDRLSAGVEGSREEAFNQEQARADSLERYGVNLSWRIFGDSGIGGNLSKSRGHNDLGTAWNDGLDSYVEIFSGFPLGRFHQQKGRLFVRYTNRSYSSFDQIFDVATDQSGWTMTTGATVSLR